MWEEMTLKYTILCKTKQKANLDIVVHGRSYKNTLLVHTYI